MFYPAVGMLGFFILLVIFELMGYARGQRPKEDSAKKWVEFFNQVRMGLMMVLLNIVNKNHSDVKYSILLVLIIYVLFHFTKYIFGYQPIEQILFILS